MLQEFAPSSRPKEALGVGASVCFQCEDALALCQEFKGRERPFVGNQIWVVALIDPDGYRIEFESPTDAPEESELGRREQVLVSAVQSVGDRSASRRRSRGAQNQFLVLEAP